MVTHKLARGTFASSVSPRHPREYCGIFAVENYRGNPTAAEITFFGLQGLQHRGQESAGIAFTQKNSLHVKKGMGLVNQIFSQTELSRISSSSALGHVRYSTTGSSNIENAQPLIAHSSDGYSFALAHNGNLANSYKLRQKLLEEGHIFLTSTDTEILLSHLYRNRNRDITDSVSEIMELSHGAYSAALIDSEKVVAFRDPHGFRPLCIGRLGEANIFASETCALDTVGGTFIREVEPGEIVTSCGGKLTTFKPEAAGKIEKSFCIFEFVYFARADSILDGKSVHQVRKSIGKSLAAKIRDEIDMVVPSPDSGISAAIGLSEATGTPLEWGIHRNPFGGRTFIQPGQSSREIRARLKYNPIAPLVEGKSIAVVDDSLVRGTTARQLISLLKKAGARAVHMIIASPPYLYPCYYGIDIPLVKELAVASANLREMAHRLGAESITFASLEDLYQGVGGAREYCTGCFSGKYPLFIPSHNNRTGEAVAKITR